MNMAKAVSWQGLLELRSNPLRQAFLLFLDTLFGFV